MLILKKNINPLFFIHIPRTGGRYIRELFIKNKYAVSFVDFSEHCLNKEIPHLQYPYYNKFTHNGKIPQFTIVRNPIERFISMLSCSIVKDNLNIDLNKILNNKNLLFDFINTQISSLNYNTNWFLPQHHFLNYNSKVWKYENGIKDKFYKWMDYNFKLKFNDIDIKYIKVEYDNSNKIKLKKNTIEFIKEYYQLDFKLLDYK
jgi:hypothetical protein